MNKTIFKIMLLSAVAIVIAACSDSPKYRIGVSQCSDDDWRSKMNEEIMREAMFHDSIEVEIRSADDSNAKQIADLDYFMANDFDIIIVAPNEADALTPKIQEIYETGKPVIVFDRTIHGDYYTAFQGADNQEIGQMAATLAGTLVDQPRIIEIMGLRDSSPAEYRHSGFRETADSLGYEVLGEAYGNWNYEEAQAAADSLISLYPQANLIYAHNDRMAIGASDIAHQRGRDDIKVIGIDAAPSIGIQAVQDGQIDATFLYPTEGHQLLRTAIAILDGKPYEKNLKLPTAAPVDKSNAEILLLQDNALREETDKINTIKGRLDLFSERYAIQTNALYASAIIIILCAVLLFVLLRLFWNGKRHRRLIEARNAELARQRDELDALYQQLQEATGSKLTFFTNVSHDLRTPLTLIADPVERLSESDNLTSQQHTLMQLANKNVKRLQRLINQILDIRKYDSGHLRLNLVNINLSESMREWVAPFADVATRRHIKFVADIPQSPQISTAIDVEKAERILFNLLSNAFKFTPENGTITVSLASDGANAIIKVADNGAGIPAEDIRHIFERFFKTDQINPNGSGIGLALSKVFIDMHGGSISVESQEGKGSTFTVTLPIRHTEDGEAAVAPTSDVFDMSEIEEIEDEALEIAEDTPVVLVIDDNRDICTLIKSELAGHFTVITASAGAQGIRLASKYLPDLIICDVMMPGMDGYQVCRALKGEPLTAHIPVLLLTACSRDEQRTEGYECGADAFMSKPFDSRMLIARCQSLIANRQLIYHNLDAKPAKPAAGQPQAAVEDEFVAQFLAIVEREIANSELSVEAVADELGLSRVQMYRKIKATTNYSAAELMRVTRLKRASVMLKTTSSTVSEVAYAVGFSSPSYFSRCYKDYYGETPLDTQSRTSKAGEKARQ